MGDENVQNVGIIVNQLIEICDREVIVYFLCSLAKLQRDRWAGGGIRFVREGGTTKPDKNGRVQIFGGKVYYLKADIEEHLASKRPVYSTSEIGEA